MANSFVRLRGLPFGATEQELGQWFQSAPGGPVQILRVIFTFNSSGRKSGEAVRAAAAHTPRPAPVAALVLRGAGAEDSTSAGCVSTPSGRAEDGFRAL